MDARDGVDFAALVGEWRSSFLAAERALRAEGADEVSTKVLTATTASRSSGRITRAATQRPP
jgi:hypothetical protein